MEIDVYEKNCSNYKTPKDKFQSFIRKILRKKGKNDSGDVDIHTYKMEEPPSIYPSENPLVGGKHQSDISYTHPFMKPEKNLNPFKKVNMFKDLLRFKLTPYGPVHDPNDKPLILTFSTVRTIPKSDVAEPIKSISSITPENETLLTSSEEISLYKSTKNITPENADTLQSLSPIQSTTANYYNYGELSKKPSKSSTVNSASYKNSRQPPTKQDNEYLLKKKNQVRVGINCKNYGHAFAMAEKDCKNRCQGTPVDNNIYHGGRRRKDRYGHGDDRSSHDRGRRSYSNRGPYGNGGGRGGGCGCCGGGCGGGGGGGYSRGGGRSHHRKRSYPNDHGRSGGHVPRNDFRSEGGRTGGHYNNRDNADYSRERRRRACCCSGGGMQLKLCGTGNGGGRCCGQCIQLC